MSWTIPDIELISAGPSTVPRTSTLPLAVRMSTALYSPRHMTSAEAAWTADRDPVGMVIVMWRSLPRQPRPRLGSSLTSRWRSANSTVTSLLT